MSLGHGDRTPKSTVGGYQDLRVWQAAIELAAECYVRTARFPAHERFGMTSQMRRAAVAVVSNIAEGHGRDSAGAFANHLSIARGSVKELEAQAILAIRVELTCEGDMRRLRQMCSATARMLHALRETVKRGHAVPNPRLQSPDAVIR